ncbi:hypothetical protein C8F01DRAFT_71152 [Mycena amicta]|nr:hypothetical protein C8F01DRAFT_71152 [Mycena amicta]
MSQYIPTKAQLKPQRHHGYSVLLFILGTLLPPLAVAARFGIGSDFWLNLLLTICGYIPGHGHNFYIQVNSVDPVRLSFLVLTRHRISETTRPMPAHPSGPSATVLLTRPRSNATSASRNGHPVITIAFRAPLLKEHHMQKDKNTSRLRVCRQIAMSLPRERRQTVNCGDPRTSSTTTRTTLRALLAAGTTPANFDDAALTTDNPKKKKKSAKKDRWARTEDAYSISEEQSRKKRSKKKKSQASLYSRDSTIEGPEAAEGGQYGDQGAPPDGTGQPTTHTAEDVFNHEF